MTTRLTADEWGVRGAYALVDFYNRRADYRARPTVKNYDRMKASERASRAALTKTRDLELFNAALRHSNEH